MMHVKIVHAFVKKFTSQYVAAVEKPPQLLTTIVNWAAHNALIQI